MKFFELADCLQPVVGKSLARAPYLRELISMFTTVSETEWNTRADPSALPSDATLEAMASRDTSFTKKFANAITSRWGIENFVDRLDDLQLPTKRLIADNIAKYGEQIDLEYFAEDVAQLMVEIVHEKARTDRGKDEVLRKIAVQGARSRYEKLIIARSRGCAFCGAPLSVTSHESQQDSYQIVFLDTDGTDFTPNDFAALCKTCGEKYSLNHTPEDIEALKSKNRLLAMNDQIDERLVPLGLDAKITELLKAIHNLPVEDLAPDVSYDVMAMKVKLDDAQLVRRVRDHMTIYESVVREKAKALEEAGQLDFERMRDDIWGAWHVLVRQGLSKDEIWARLTDWIHRHTEIDEYACGIVVSFLTQICELFKPRRSILS